MAVCKKTPQAPAVGGGSQGSSPNRHIPGAELERNLVNLPNQDESVLGPCLKKPGIQIHRLEVFGWRLLAAWASLKLSSPQPRHTPHPPPRASTPGSWKATQRPLYTRQHVLLSGPVLTCMCHGLVPTPRELVQVFLEAIQPRGQLAVT